MSSRMRFLTGLVAGLLLGGCITWAWYHNIQRKYDHLMVLAQQQEHKIAVQDAVMDSMQMQPYSGMLTQLVRVIDTERQEGHKWELSEEMISRMASLSFTFKPIAHLEGDSLSSRKRSPERGQLLVYLCGLDLDTATLLKIYKRVTFAGADVRGADLQGAFLHGIQLSGADLSNTNLNQVDLSHAQLDGATLWGATLQNATLNNADCKGADLRWCNINQAHLIKTILTEADLTSAQLREANLYGANLQWVALDGAFLNSAVLDSTDMFRATCKRAQFEKTTLIKTNLNLADLTEANMTEAVLTDANLSDVVVGAADWFTQLREWRVIGTDQIETGYHVVTSNTTGKPFFQLKKKP